MSEMNLDGPDLRQVFDSVTIVDVPPDHAGLLERTELMMNELTYQELKLVHAGIKKILEDRQ